MREGIENSEFVQSVNFEFIDQFKNNGRKYLLFFDTSCEQVCTLKAPADNATAGTHRNLSTICNKHTLFHQNGIGREFQLRDRHIILFKAPRDLMQVNTLSAQLRPHLVQADWYRAVISVPYGHLMID